MDDQNTPAEGSLMHWRHFLALEDDLQEALRYVELSVSDEPRDSNWNTHSIEFVRLLLSTCSEVEVVCKELCEELAPGELSDRSDICDYREILTERIGGNKDCDGIHDITIQIPSFNYQHAPWESWGDVPPKNPTWWREHQCVKHARHKHFKLANLGNAVNALMGLFALLLLMRKKRDQHQLGQRPSLLEHKAIPSSIVDGGGHNLPDFV